MGCEIKVGDGVLGVKEAEAVVGSRRSGKGQLRLNMYENAISNLLLCERIKTTKITM